MNHQQLFAGAGVAPVCFPPELFPMEGFISVHDDPSVRILLLDCGERAAIVCAEMVMLPPETIQAAKQIIGSITGTREDHIWVHTTHVITTPHAPHAPIGMGGVRLELNEAQKNEQERKLELFNTPLTDAFTKAAEGAASTFRAAKMGIGTGECSVNVNRDLETPHGWWISFAPDGPSNHTATVLRFEDEAGAPIGALISYGLKPCCIDNSEMDVNNRQVSSDVPGLACRLLEEQLGAPVLFAMSAAGDQVPVEQAWYDVVEDDGTVRKVDLGVQAGLEMVDRLGRRMAEQLAPVLEQIICDRAAPAINLDSSHIEWPGKKRMKFQLRKSAEFTAEGTQRVDALAMTIGDVALVGTKPEVNTVTEAQLQAASPYEHTLLISMVNGGQKYMPDQASYDRITWESQSSALMPGAAEAWVEETANLLDRMHNK